MEKIPVQSSKSQSHDWCDTETYKGKTMKPRDFEVTASSGADGPPVQRKGDLKAEVKRTEERKVNDQNRDKIFNQSGSQPNPESPNDKVRGEVNYQTETISGSLYEYGGVDFLRGEVSANVGVNNTKRGVGIQGGIDVKGQFVHVDKKLQLGPFKVKVFDEDTFVNLALGVTGMVGVEAEAKFNARMSKIQSTRDIFEVSEKNLKYGVEGGVDAFAGVKVDVAVVANYDWVKKKKEYYVEKFMKNMGNIKQGVKKIDPDLGAWLEELPTEESERYVAAFLYGLGADGMVNLVEAKAGAWGAYGAGLQVKGGLRMTGGKFYYHSKMGIAWGLGFGGEISLSLSLLEGVLFGLAIGGELSEAAIHELKRLVSGANLDSLKHLLWERVTFWREKKKVSKLDLKGKNASSNSSASSNAQSSSTVKPLPQRPRAPICDTSFNALLNKDYLNPVGLLRF